MPPRRNNAADEVKEEEELAVNRDGSAGGKKVIRALKSTMYKEWRVSARVFFATIGLSDVIAGLVDDKYKVDEDALRCSVDAADSTRIIRGAMSRAVFAHLIEATEKDIPLFHLLEEVMDSDKGMDGRAAWFKLEATLAARTKISWNTVRTELFGSNQRQQEDESVVDYADRTRVLGNQLKKLGVEVTEEWSGMMFLGGLLSKFDSRKLAMDTQSDVWKLDPAVQLIKEYESKHVAVEEKIRKMTASTVSVNQLESKYVPTCFKCGEKGHMKPACPKANGPKGAGAAVVCTFCKMKGHTEDKCFKKKNQPNNSNAGNFKRANANMVQVVKARDSYVGAVNRGTRSAIGKNLAENRFSESLNPEHAFTEVNYSSLRSKKKNCQELFLDSAASNSMGGSSLVLSDPQPAMEVHIKTASAETLHAPSRGNLKLKTRTGKVLTIEGVLSHKKLRNNLLGVHHLTTLGAVDHVRFYENKSQIIGTNDEVLFEGGVRNGMYPIEVAFDGTFHQVNTIQVLDKNDTQLWHARLGHFHVGGLDKLQRSGAVEGFHKMTFTVDPMDPCISCIKGKAHRAAFSKCADGKYKLKEAGQQIVSDIAGPFPVSYDAMIYAQVFVDAVVSHVTVQTYDSKSDVIQGSQDFLTAVANKFGQPVKQFHTDGGSEFTSNAFLRYCRTHGIASTITVPDTPQHDGKSERMIRTLVEMTRSMIFSSGAARYLWTDALKHAAYIYNRVKLVDGFNKTPQQLWDNTEEKTDVSGLAVWGCDAWMTTPLKQRGSKFDSRARLMMFLGYNKFYRTGYKLLDVVTMKVEYSRDVKFLETQFTQAQALRAAVIDGDDESEDGDFMKWMGRNTDQNELELVKKISLEEANARTTKVAADAQVTRGRRRPRGSDVEPVKKSDFSTAAPKKKQVTFTPQSIEQRARHSRRVSQTPSRYGMVNAKDIGQALAVAAVVSDEQRELQPERAVDRSFARVSRVKDVDKHTKRGMLIPTRQVNKGEEPLSAYGATHWSAIKRKARKRRAVALAHAAEVYDGVVRIPQTYNEAINSVERHNWLKGIQSELDSLALNQTWSLVNAIPAGRKKIGCKWVFAVKRDSEGKVVRYKARLVAKGFSQVKHQDYNETFAPVLDTRTLRLLLSLVAHYDLECKQFDVETAFLNATLDEENYMEIPQGLPHSSNEIACKLQKSIYGLKQASYEWNKLFVKEIMSLGYTQLKYADDCVFLKMSRNGRPILTSIFVDDGINICHSDDMKELDADMQKLMQRFKIKDLGDINLILGMRVKRDRSAKVLTLDQEVYTVKLLNEWGFADSKSVDTPETSSSTQAAFEKNSSNKRDNLKETGKLTLENYGSIVGALNYLTLATRPDISHAVNMLARDLVKPTLISLMAVKRVLRYLNGTRDKHLCYKAEQGCNAKLVGFSDADWAGDAESAKSTSGLLVKLAGGPISWSSKKQTIVALSSTEVRYIALCEVGREVVWLRSLLSQLRMTDSKESVLIHVDNQTAIKMAQDEGNNARRKHINVKYHWIRELIQDGAIQVKWIRTDEQQADVFTKGVHQPAFQRLGDQVMGNAVRA
jgi:hypothetical protein